MARTSRFTHYGVSGRFFGVIIAATGTMACGATLTGVSGDTGSTGSVAVASSWTGVGKSIAAGVGGNFLARGIFDAGVGNAIYTATGAASGGAQFVGSSGGQIGRLTHYGVSGRFYSPVPKGASVPRLWNVSETFGLSIAVSDFTERHFYLVDRFGISITESLVFTGGVGSITAASTWSGVSLAATNSVGSITSASTWSGVGQNVITSPATGSLTVAVTFAGQGSTAGTVFGVGVGSMPNTITFDGIGRSNAAAVASMDSTSTFTGVGAPLGVAIGLLTSASTWSGDSTVNVPAVGDLSAAVTFTGASLQTGAAVGSMPVNVAFNGRAIIEAVAVIASCTFVMTTSSMTANLTAPEIWIKAA